MRTVCAVIVTYNRPELLARCVSKVLNQEKITHILIYDNHSSTNTKQFLIDNGVLDTDIITYYYADENSGGSGGFHNGMKMAYDAGYDELLLMDDDGYPANNSTLTNLLIAREKIGDNAILNSLVVCDEKSLKLSFSLNREYDGRKIQKIATNGMLKDYISPFNGTLISSKIVEKIGLPKKEYFVYGDETEYYFRAKANAVDCYTVTDSIYYHPTNVGQMKKIFGFNLSINDVPMWKVYCSSRNSANYIYHYFGWKGLAKLIARAYIGIAFSAKDRMRQFKTVSIGIHDGIKGNFTRDINSF